MQFAAASSIQNSPASTRLSAPQLTGLCAAWKSAGMLPSSIVLIEGIDVPAADNADPEDEVNAEIYIEDLLETEHKPLRWQLLRDISVAVAQYETPAQAQAVQATA